MPVPRRQAFLNPSPGAGAKWPPFWGTTMGAGRGPGQAGASGIARLSGITRQRDPSGEPRPFPHPYV